ncbi:EPHB5-like protein [Mya arenaria]|uniref:EPHB5-like protein n=1 Tax=Mya arenaria TaxID=6604 RepID=A0ABY7EK25_MYAAR|nr:EPHB5-like protein [Mya arenaria]
MLYDSKMKCLIDIAQGMEFLYDNIIIHCDLTARNVLLTSDLTAKVADFGWAKELENDCENSTYRRTDSQFKLHTCTSISYVRKKAVY